MESQSQVPHSIPVICFVKETAGEMSGSEFVQRDTGALNEQLEPEVLNNRHYQHILPGPVRLKVFHSVNSTDLNARRGDSVDADSPMDSVEDVSSQSTCLHLGLSRSYHYTADTGECTEIL